MIQDQKQSMRAAGGTRQPEADSGHDYPMPTPQAKTAAAFYQGLIGPATLSVAASQLAVEKAANADTAQFARFELREAIAVVGILNGLNVPAPSPSADGEALLEKLRATPPGVDFDRTYISAELANHEFLRDLADSYLASATGPTNDEEAHGRNLAALAITAFKEHVVLSKNIVQALNA